MFQSRVNDQRWARISPLAVQIFPLRQVLQTSNKAPSRVTELLEEGSWLTSLTVAREAEYLVPFKSRSALEVGFVANRDFLSWKNVSDCKALDGLASNSRNFRIG